MRLIFGGNSDMVGLLWGVRVGKDICDITDYTAVESIVRQLKPDEVVNYAGVLFPAMIRDSDIYLWAKEITVNLIGSYYIARACSSINAKMVFIGSTSGLKGRAYWSGYSASKAGLISLVQSLSEEGHNAWCVSPSRTATKMRSKLFPEEDTSSLMKPDRVAGVVEDCFKGKYESGSNVIVYKDDIKVKD